VRLFDRRRGGWSGYEIHENTQVQAARGGFTAISSTTPTASLADHQNRMQRYAELMAQAMYERGRRCGLTPWW